MFIKVGVIKNFTIFTGKQALALEAFFKPKGLQLY